MRVEDVIDAGLLPVADEPPSEDGPSHIRFATLAAYRGHPLSVSGVILTADFDGSMSDLVAFVLGLSTQALLHLGEIPNPVSKAIERDLVAAKQVIDILGILREKTRNNLESAEESLLDSMLYDLRMRYVQLVRGSSKEGT